MNRSCLLPAVVAAALATSLLAGCSGSGADEVRLAEPVLDFPQTSTTPTPALDNDEEEAEEEEESATSSSTTSTTTTSSTRTSTSSSSRRSSGAGSNSRNEAREPVQVRETIVDDRPGATCAWPAQGESSGGQEYSTFCDREWARTVTPDGTDYYWVARGGGWVSVDPAGTGGAGECWSRQDFEGAPEAVRNAVTFCGE